MKRMSCLAAFAMLASCTNPAASDDTNVATVTEDGQTSATLNAENAKPSFDCARADGQAQQLICNDASLAALDVELARLYTLAEATDGIDAARLNELKSMQRGWIKGRDDCWKADDLRQCVVQNYAVRIHELREGYANSRSEDEAGSSTGPLAYLCEGIDAGISAIFVEGDPAVANLKWLDRVVSFEHVRSGSGAKYEGPSFDGTWTFWTKGDEAILTHPERGDLSCMKDVIG